MKFLLVFIVALIGVIVTGSEVSGLKVNEECKRVEVVFARGSGESLSNKNYDQFVDQVGYRVKSTNFYELGTESYGDAQYSAISMDDLRRRIEAYVVAGTAFDYGDSVIEGRKEFIAYIQQRMNKCKDALFVVGGYSQGAQAIREGVSLLSTELKQRIEYIALFGDPKLHLPEGYGLFPDACRGKNLSSWRATVPECRTYAGVLEAQRPFVTNDLAYKTKLWCNKNDVVCGSVPLWGNSEGHEQYANSGGAIDDAAKRIANKVKAKLPPEEAESINIKPSRGLGITGHDTIIVIDAHQSMQARFAEVKNRVRSVATGIDNAGGRYAIVLYGTHSQTTENGNLYPGELLILPFEAGHTAKMDRLDALEQFAPVRGPVFTVLTGVTEHMEWRLGATRSLLLFTNEYPLSNPDYMGTTQGSALKTALKTPPTSIFPVVPEDNKNAYLELANKSSGKVFTMPNIALMNRTMNQQDEVLQAIFNRPVVLFALPEYFALSGQDITFDVSESYALDSEIVKYEWDFEGDLEFEQTTTVPTIDHTYATEGDRIVQVRVTAANGMIANGSATVKIGQPEVPVLTAAPQNLTVTPVANDPTRATLAWNAADTLAADWAVSVNGIKLGLLAADRTSIEVRDLERAEDIEFGVAGVTAEGRVGEAATVTLAKPVVPPVEPPVQACNSGNFLQDLICQTTAWYNALIKKATQWWLMPWL